ncbi:hypothetical protein LLB_0993 [Legionella longbeachae D-4968]|nr:hypothetical protein LLB_0993 [Legionella longbeachae D-4968]
MICPKLFHQWATYFGIGSVPHHLITHCFVFDVSHKSYENYTIREQDIQGF